MKKSPSKTPVQRALRVGDPVIIPNGDGTIPEGQIIRINGDEVTVRCTFFRNMDLPASLVPFVKVIRLKLEELLEWNSNEE